MIRKLRVGNWFNHPKRELTFNNGITVIIGENGVGKSNLLDAIVYALTGYSAIASSAIPAYPHLGATEVHLELDVPSVHDIALVSREIITKNNSRSTQVKLTLANDKDFHIKSTTQAVNQLAQWFNCDPFWFMSSLISKQGSLTRIAELNNSERASLISDIINIHTAEVARDALSEVTTTLVNYDTSHLEGEITSDTQALNELRSVLSKLPDTSEEELHVLKEKFDSISYSNAKFNEAQDAREKVLELHNEILKLNRDLDNLNEGIGELSSIASHKDDVRNKLELTSSYNTWFKSIDVFNEKIVNYKNLVSNIPPHPGDEPKQCEELSRLNSLSSHNQKLCSLSPTDPCPTCKSLPSSELQRSISEAVKDESNRAELHKDFVIAHNNYLSSLSEHNNAVNRVNRLETELLRDKEHLTNSKPKQDMPEETYSDLTARYEEIELALGKLSQLTSQANNIKTSIDFNNKEITRLTKLISDAPKSFTDARELSSKVRVMIESFQKRCDLQSRIEFYEKHLPSKIKQLEDIKKKIREQQVHMLFVESCNKVRRVLHRDQAPALTINQYLKNLGNCLSSWVQSFGCKYRLVVEDNWYKADFGTHIVDIRRLSGAEKLVFGLSWHLAVRDNSCGSFPMVILDEPTYGMDKKRIESLRTALLKWRELSGEAQLLIVTHDSRLSELADDVILLQGT